MTTNENGSRESPAPERLPHAALDQGTRTRKARKIMALLGPRRLRYARRLLEVGCGSGLIASAMAKVNPKLVVQAVDVVDNRTDTRGYDFELVRGTALPSPNGMFDLVISNHVIEHVGDARAQRHHLEEIHRVLSPGGTVYLAVPNRWRLVEPHYRLPFLSWLPHPASDRYVRALRRGTHYDCAPPSHAQALALFRSAGFIVQDCTIEAVRETLRIEMSARVSTLFDRLVPGWICRLLMPVMPTYVFLLEHAPAIVDGNEAQHRTTRATRSMPPRSVERVQHAMERGYSRTRS